MVILNSDVLFIIHDVYQEDNQFPLGVGYLASVLREYGFSSEMYCMDVFHYSNDDLARKLDESEYQLICVGFLAARFNETILELCRVINEHKKNSWLVLGGHGPSPVPCYMLFMTKCDVVCVGEAENTILKVLMDKKNGVNKRVYESIPCKNLDDIPFPAWELFPMDRYMHSVHFKGMTKKDKMFNIVSTRGCINACTFCYRMEKGIRLRSVDSVIEEMKILHDEYGMSAIRFQDEMFLVSKKRLFEFRDKLKESGYEFKFYIDARVDFFDDETARALKKMGCIGIDFGFESSSQKVLDYMHKNTTVEKNIRVLETCKKHDIPVGLNFIWGYPPDDYESMENNAWIIMKYNHYQSLRTQRPVTPYPGCALYYEAIKKGLIGCVHDFFKRFRNSDRITINFTRFPDKICYTWFYNVNKALIYDHYEHTGGDVEERDLFVQQMSDVYDGVFDSFRGFRHYEKSKAV